MKRIYWGMAVLWLFLTVGSMFVGNALADHDDDRHRYENRVREHAEHYGERDVAAVKNATYIENCGACHWAYQPGLLPSGSWDKIMKNLSDHFGETVDLDPEAMNKIALYLKANGADHSSAKLSRKIMKSMGSERPLRITQVPYIKREHHEIVPQVFERQGIGSFSNCLACHKTAENGIYDDDAVTIPNRPGQGKENREADR